jgi:hypothetical protein
MPVEPKELTEYKTDHDLLIELRILLIEMRRDMRDMKEGTTATLVEHEKRIRSLEDTRKETEGRSGAFSWLGALFYSAIALIAGLIATVFRIHL